MATVSANGAEQLLNLLDRQRDLYGRLQGLSTRQRGLISGEQPELLLDILRERQGLVMALAQLNQELAPYRSDWEARLAALSPESRAKATALLATIQKTLQAILDADREDSALLAARKRLVAQSLNQLAGTAAAHQAYSRKAGSTYSAESADMTG